MGNGSGYAVYFFPQALEALGEAIKPYLLDGPAGVHVLCHHVDTGGAFVEMTLHGKAHDDTALELELMVPSGMVRMVVSAHSDDAFGFGPRALPSRASDPVETPVARASGTHPPDADTMVPPGAPGTRPA